MIKRAYAYLRVSTFQQVDGKSLTGQEEEIRKYCNVYGIELVDVYSDEGKSGKSIEGRPQFQKMLRDIKEKQEVDYVIVWKLSRFGRNACDSLNSLNILQDNGVNLVALTENVDTATPMGRLVFTLLAALAEMERENIREQTANGLKYNALSGGWNGGIPPYGYDAVNKELVINEEEATVVRKIFEWYLESEEASCDSVTGRLNEEGIKPRHYKRVDRKATEESETDETVYLPPVADWYTSQVKKILDNPTVCGKIRYGYHKTDDTGNKGKQSGDSENDYILVDGKHEAIISEEMWNRAQEKRKKSRKPRGRRDSTSESVNNVFNGIVKCPQCGAHMINYGSRYKKTNGEESYYSTYVCGYWNNHKKGKCRKNPIKTEILEKAVIGGLREYTRRPNLAEEIHQYMEQELDTGKLEKETEELKNKIAALDKNEDMQYKILCQIGVNPTYQNMKPERIQINLDKIVAEKNELQERLDYKMKQIESVQLEKMDFELVKNLLENFNEVYEDAPKELRKRLVRSLIKEVQLGYDDKGKVVPVKMILKFSGEQIELMKEHKENFGLNEAHAEPEELRDFLASLASYVLACDVTLQDGETIGFSADDKHTITRSPGVSLPEEQMTLKIGYEPIKGDPEDDSCDHSDNDDTQDEEEFSNPEVYTEEEMEAVEGHIQQYFGKFENVFHEIVSPDIHVDICIVPPTEERDYYTLVTMGMGAHRMNVPEELAEYKLERAELAIALPADWKLDQESMKDEKWYWPIRLLKSLARLPINCDSWLGHGHTVENREPFADNTKLCTATLIGPQDTEDGSEVCTLPGGEEVNFYQVIPLYEDELDYKLEHDVDALLNKMRGISFVVNPTRQNAITRGTLSNDDFDGEMDDASYHIESIEEKELPIDPINAYNHMAIYLRWCMEHDLMGEEFLAEYGEVVEKVKADSASVDLREFIRDELDGCLFSVLFNQQGRAFAGYYYGEGDSPYYPADVDDNALRFFGPERYHSDEFQDEAYLFIPFDEDYYQAMAEVIEERFANWQGQDFDEDTLEPSEVAQAIMEYLDCECTYFPSMADDDPIMSAYSYAKRESVREGFVPVLIQADDETLLECLVMNADPENDADFYEFDLKTVAEYRKKMLSAPVKDGKALLEELTGQRRAEAEDDDLDWDEEVLGEMEGGYDNDRFSCYWDSDSHMTYPLILAKIPVKNPWEIFAYLPFGNWNECPATPDLMAAAKYWFEQHGAIPAAMSHDELEFLLPAPVPKEKAMEAATEQYGFCPDIVDQEQDDPTVGNLADVLRQSTVWYFWWD